MEYKSATIDRRAFAESVLTLVKLATISRSTLWEDVELWTRSGQSSERLVLVRSPFW
jgi:hypothetical protein